MNPHELPMKPPHAVIYTDLCRLLMRSDARAQGRDQRTRLRAQSGQLRAGDGVECV